MKTEDNSNTDKEECPLASVIELVAEHSIEEVLQSISAFTKIAQEDKKDYDGFREYYARWQLELEQLLIRMNEYVIEHVEEQDTA